MSVASDMAPYAIMYMGPVIGFLALSSFLWINLTLDAGHREMVRKIVRFFWSGAGVAALAGVLHVSGALPYDGLQQIYAAMSGAVIGASGVVVVQTLGAPGAAGIHHQG